MAPYHRPETLPDALRLLASGGAVAAAGCTDLFPATPRAALSGSVVDLTRVAELRGISETGEGWRLGAATRWSELLRTPLPPAFDGLKAAAREVGSVQIQNAGTLGGNLCNASPAADGVPCLLTLEAEVELASARGDRRLPLATFITGARRTALDPGEVLVALHVPARAARGRGAFRKLGARRYLVISIAMVAARLELAGGRIATAALSVGACGPVATRLPAQEAALLGLAPDAAAAQVSAALVAPALSPIGDVRGGAEYRIEAAVELLRRALSDLTIQGFAKGDMR
ncbi:xanthine dehydrogenase [Defluviimonas sp. 20V17]|uniref:Xanthine dehydrogenase n=1 Tax=Allgaiera indica TaxID=765699 RepID=A0AAN4UP61_9RHOB|nr:FAD binding domain-containing protein [Allgaiera indica]KDB04199.1 xanthine dehydrogenase [Defluviimonas sp. 20V17]GHD99463.1 xanthine dehydrogenase [Allgaiera indica]SDW25209.1 CO or xanthine dehydrogenase, FAD-binding subunit [Allgaiera indica]